MHKKKTCRSTFVHICTVFNRIKIYDGEVGISYIKGETTLQEGFGLYSISNKCVDVVISNN